MSKGYSVDLRERVLQALDEGMSKMTAHRTFHISRSTIDHWLALRAQTGGVSPRASRAGRTSSLRGLAFEEFVCRHAHATRSRTPRWTRWYRRGGTKQAYL